MGVVAESGLNIVHIRTTTCQHNATQKLVTIFFRNLTPYVGNNFFHATLDNLNELANFYLAFGVNGVFHVVVNIAILSVGTAVLQLHLLSICFFHLQGSDIFGDIVGAEGDDGNVAKDILRVYTDGSSVCTQVNKCTSRTTLCLSKYAVSEG